MRRLLVVLLVMMLIMVLWWFFVVGPINERKDIAQIDLETAQTEEFTLRTTLSRLKKIEENQLEYATAIGQLQTAIPPTPRLAELIDDLSQLADENGLAWSSGAYTLPSSVDNSDFFEIGFSVQVQGQFFELLGYLYGIADLERLVRVDSITLSSSADEAGFHAMAASIAGVVFTTSETGIPIELSSLLSEVEAAVEEAVDEAIDEVSDEVTDESTTTTTEGT